MLKPIFASKDYADSALVHKFHAQELGIGLVSWAIGIPICHRASAQTMCVSQTKVTPERWSTTKDTLSIRPHKFLESNVHNQGHQTKIGRTNGIHTFKESEAPGVPNPLFPPVAKPFNPSASQTLKQQRPRQGQATRTTPGSGHSRASTQT